MHLMILNLLNAELYLICHLLSLSGAHHIFHISGLRVKLFCFFTSIFITILLHDVHFCYILLSLVTGKHK